jgi:hypothetical protein
MCMFLSELLSLVQLWNTERFGNRRQYPDGDCSDDGRERAAGGGIREVCRHRRHDRHPPRRWSQVKLQAMVTLFFFYCAISEIGARFS